MGFPRKTPQHFSGSLSLGHSAPRGNYEKAPLPPPGVVSVTDQSSGSAFWSPSPLLCWGHASHGLLQACTEPSGDTRSGPSLWWMVGLRTAHLPCLSTPTSTLQPKTLLLTTLPTSPCLYVGQTHTVVWCSPSIPGFWPIFSQGVSPLISCVSNPLLASASQRNWTNTG